jgi:uncharacterized RDD family membrane protein YckC
MSLVQQSDPADRGESLRSFVIGSAVMCLTYAIPFVGFVVWLLAGLFGLGAATLAFYGNYRRENPRPPRKAAAPAPVVPPPPPFVPAADAAPMAAAPAIPFEGGSHEVEPPVASVLPEEAIPPRQTPLAGAAIVMTRGTFAERLAALVLDAIIIMILVQFFDFDHYGGPSERLTVLIALAYHVGFWTWQGTTPGGMICQLRVVRIDGKPLEFAESLVRGLTGIVSLAVVGLGFFWMLRDPDRQTWHDRVAGTYVVKAR